MTKAQILRFCVRSARASNLAIVNSLKDPGIEERIRDILRGRRGAAMDIAFEIKATSRRKLKSNSKQRELALI